VVALPCEASWELEDFWLCVCVAPLWLGGLRGKKSTPSVGWEVPVKSLRLCLSCFHDSCCLFTGLHKLGLSIWQVISSL
jgi:hypothetical protein